MERKAYCLKINNTLILSSTRDSKFRVAMSVCGFGDRSKAFKQYQEATSNAKIVRVHLEEV